jgi:hypothetical protein
MVFMNWSKQATDVFLSRELLAAADECPVLDHYSISEKQVLLYRRRCSLDEMHAGIHLIHVQNVCGLLLR